MRERTIELPVLASCGVGTRMAQQQKSSQYAASVSVSGPSDDEIQCIVDLLGYELNTSSFTLYSFSLAIVFQTLLLISIGAIADYGKTTAYNCPSCSLTYKQVATAKSCC